MDRLSTHETDALLNDIKLKVNLLTSIDKKFLIKYIKQTIKEEPKEMIEKNCDTQHGYACEELHRNNLVKFHF